MKQEQKEVQNSQMTRSKWYISFLNAKMIYVGIFCALVFWVVEAVIHTLLFPESNFLKELLFLTHHELWMRLFICCLFLVFGVYSHIVIAQVKSAENELKKINETLEQRVAKRAEELAEIKEQLYHSQKMESVGRLAGGVAHDFNNILMAIVGYAHLTEMSLEEDTSAREFVQKILESSDKAAKITQSLLAFSRKQTASLEPVGLNNIIENIGNILPKITLESIVCKLNLAPEEIVIMADRDQIEQVTMNLATNAVDSMPNGGNLTISTDIVELDKEFLKEYNLDRAGTYSVLSVSDTGHGMNETTKGKIFEPFFTTKERGKGTGLGLAIAYGIIRQHNGCIDVSSLPDKGTTFNIYLPLADAVVQETNIEKISKENTLSVASELILLAEDDITIREMLINILKSKGYAVIAAVDGEEAINRFNENKDNVHLLLFDIMMPKKTGKEAFDTIQKIKPGIKVLFLSGYSDDIDTNRSVYEENLNYIQKPVLPEKLLGKIREVLSMTSNLGG